MPEEINRLVTDRLSDLLLAPDMLSVENLRSEGVPEHRIRFVGNIMIDTLESNRSRAESLDTDEIIKKYSLPGDLEQLTRALKTAAGSSFAVITLHRPSNVDTKEILEPIVDFLTGEVAEELTLLWPVHPRTLKMLTTFGLNDKIASHQNIILLQPLGYLEMLKLNMEARLVLTDSGGLQEECTVLGTPCLTLRSNTERPVTLREHGGASVLVGNDIVRIREAYRSALKLSRNPVRPELWDGKTAERCLKAIVEYYCEA
jgi:UDP-N-acetylglucosamine 2-epimerase (non-hydrolysing)